MKQRFCTSCQIKAGRWQVVCRDCGSKDFIEEKSEEHHRFLRRPSIGALLFTQGWTFGAKLYLLCILSFIPITGPVILVISFLFGRRLSWNYGTWDSWESFIERMKILDIIAYFWIVSLIIIYFIARLYT